jgi:hypothetical protein
MKDNESVSAAINFYDSQLLLNLNHFNLNGHIELISVQLFIFILMVHTVHRVDDSWAVIAMVADPFQKDNSQIALCGPKPINPTKQTKGNKY